MGATLASAKWRAGGSGTKTRLGRVTLKLKSGTLSELHVSSLNVVAWISLTLPYD